MNDDTAVMITAIITIAILEAIAMICLHMDGALLSGVVATITGITLKYKELKEYYGRFKLNVRNSNRDFSPST